MDSVKVSIITPTFNSAATLADTLRSVCGQTYEPIEHIIMDGGSTDDTLEIARQWSLRYGGGKNMVINSEPDNGSYDALNKGLKLASGDVVGILNSDDFFSSSSVIAKLMAHFSEDVDAVYGDLHYVHPHALDTVVRYYSSAAFSRRRMLMGFQPAHPTFYCRRFCYDRFGGFDLNFEVAADFEQLLRMIYIGRIRTRYIPMDCVTMRTGGISTSGLKSHKKILQDHLKAYRKHKLPANIITDSMRYFWKIGEILAARMSRYGIG